MIRTKKTLCIVYAFVLICNLLIPNINCVTVLSDLSDDFAKSYNYIFIGTVVNKTVQANQTLYLFNVTENLKQPINTTQVTITTMGGSEIAVSPSTSFYTGLEYLVFFDELDKENKVIGFDYNAFLTSPLDDKRLQTIRDIAKNITDVSKIAEPNLVEEHNQADEIELAEYTSKPNWILPKEIGIAILLVALMSIVLYNRFRR